ncbi:MAG: hypothetical protein ACK4ML_00745 [Alishewanella aestuarii]
MQIRVDQFGGIAPQVHPLQLAEGLSQKAVNLRFERQVLEPFRGFTPAGFSLPSNTRSIYRYGSVFMGWANPVVKAVDAAKVSDPFDYLLIADVNYPKITRNDMATNSPPYPTTTYRLGVPQPTWPNNNPTVSRIDDAKAPEEGLDIQTATAYRLSFVNGFGFEGPLSDPTNIVRYYEGFDAISLQLPTSFPGSGHYLTGANVRIYRANSLGQYQYVDEVSLGTPAYTDDKPSDELGLLSETDNWFGPPDEDTTINPAGPLRNLTAMPGGFFIGSTGDELCASVPDAPYAWPYRTPLGYQIVGIATMGNAAVVTTTGPTFVVQGVDPSALQPTRINTNQSCVSSRSVVNVGEMVIYASPDGLVGVAGYDATILTEGLVTKEEWQAIFKPEQIHAYYYEGKYIFFNNTRGWVFRPGKGLQSLGELNFVATTGYTDTDNDKLFLMVAGVITEFDSNNARLQYDWQSKLFRSPVPTNFGYMQVIAETYPTTVSFHAKKMSGQWVQTTLTFTDAKPKFLPSGYVYQDFYFSAQGTAAINSISVAHSLSEFDYV